MGDGHDHHHHGSIEPEPPGTVALRRGLAAAVVVLLALTVAAVVALWPEPPKIRSTQPVGTVSTQVEATVVEVEARPCPPTGTCVAARVRLDSGTTAGETVELESLLPGPSTPTLQVGDRIVVTRTLSLGADDFAYQYADFQRRTPVALLAALFAVVVVAVARWRGLAALVGLVVTWLVLSRFVVPAIIDGADPVAVALAGGSLVMFAVLYLCHGVNVRTTIALLGTLASLALTGLLASFFVGATHLNGIASDEATFIATSFGDVNLSGILLCGVIIGALGALNDATVTQAAAVWEIHGADPSQSSRQIYRAGMRIGRDHIASTVYTLVLAYAGASLPLLLLFTAGSQRVSDLVTSELVAEELVRTLVGSIGLIASVPLTTLLGAVAVARLGSAAPVEELQP